MDALRPPLMAEQTLSPPAYELASLPSTPTASISSLALSDPRTLQANTLYRTAIASGGLELYRGSMQRYVGAAEATSQRITAPGMQSAAASPVWTSVNLVSNQPNTSDRCVCHQTLAMAIQHLVNVDRLTS